MATDARPIYLIAGGPASRIGRGPDPLLQEALRLAAKDLPSVAYVGAASGDNALFRRMIERLLRGAGAGDVKSVRLCDSCADPQKARRIIEKCDIVFLSGGDVEAGMKVLLENELIDFLRDQYANGKLFFGISAGSIMLAKSWVRWRDHDSESRAELFPCLGFAPIYCDTHGEGDEWDELKALSHLIPDKSMSYGIVSGAALIAQPDGAVRAIGREVHRFRRKGKVVEQLSSLIAD